MPVRCSFFMVIMLLVAISQLLVAQADSLFSLLPTLPDDEQVDQTNEHFYQLFTADFTRASQQGERALAITEVQNWPERKALILKNLGVVNFLQGNYEASLDFYQRAIDTYESIGDVAGQGAVCNELGLFFKKRKDMNRALAYLDQAFQLCSQAEDKNCVAVSLDNRGLIYLDQDQLSLADSLFQQVVSIRQSLPDSVGLSYVYNNLGELAVKRGRIENARQYLQLSTDIRQRINDRQGVAININNIGEVFLFADQPGAAIPYFEESLAESRNLRFTDLERHTLEMLSIANEGIADYQSALDWLKQSYTLKDSLFNEQRSAQIAEMQEKYESEKREKELVEQQLMLRKRTTWLLVAIVGLLLLGLIFIFVSRNHRQRRVQMAREANLRENLLRQETENKLQQERLRISRDLHDNLGAELTLISSALAQKAYRSSDEQEQQTLNDIGKNARRAMDELRGTIWAIRGEGDTVDSLALRLQDFTSRFEQADIHLAVSPEVQNLPLTPTRTLNLYRIAQEAIHNAMKHAPGTPILVAFRQIDGELELEIKDAGRGFAGSTKQKGYGLINMQERAQEMNGTFQVNSDQKGTCVTIRIPLTT